MSDEQEQERVDCVAFKFPNGKTCIKNRPARHPDVWLLAQGIGLEPHTAEQGFLTTRGRFVDRVEAYKIAKAAGQIISKDNEGPKLYSEDLW